MKLLFIICMFWAPILIEGVPNNFEVWLQPRGIGDLPFFGWLYGSSTEDIHEKDAPNLLHQQINESELDKWKSKDVKYHVTDDKIKVIPVDKVGPNEKPEPIENLLQNLKQEVNETSDEQKKNIATLLTDLNKTMKETSTNLAKVFINKAWHVFDIGALGTTRRTRNLEESLSLLAPIYVLLGLLNQLLGEVQYLGGNNLLLGNLYEGNNAQTGLFELLFPFLSNPQSGINQKVLGGIAGLPGGQNHNLSKNVLVICLDDKNKKEANRLFHGKTPDAILLRIKEFLEKNSLSEVEQFYIILKLHELFDDLSGKNNETELKLLNLIILIGEDPRFQDLFKKIKSKKEREFDDIWKLFKQKSELNNKYLTILRNLPRGKMTILKTHPSRDCFIIGPGDQRIEAVGSSDGSDGSESDSDDEELRSKRRKNSDLENFIMKLTSRDTKSKKDYYICCLDDDEELQAKRILDGKTNDETIDNIKKKIEMDDSSPKYKWYIILRLYNMLKDIEKDKDKKQKEDKEKIIKLIIVIGENPKFEPFIKEIKTKDDPRFNEIWKLLKNEPRETKVENIPTEKNNDEKEVPKISSDIAVIPEKEEKVIKEEDVKPKNEAEIVVKVEDVKPKKEAEIPEWIFKKTLPELITLDKEIWERDYEHILRYIETKIKDPALDDDSRWTIVDILDKWYMCKFIAEPLCSHLKYKAKGLVNLVKQDPKYDSVFEKIKQKNPAITTKRVFKLFEKEKKEPESTHSSQTEANRSADQQNSRLSEFEYDPYGRYYWPKNSKRPTDDYEYAKLSLTYKIDTLITIFENYIADAKLNPKEAVIRQQKMDPADTILNDNRKDFENLENVFLGQIRGNKGNDFILEMLREFKNDLIANDSSANGMRQRYLNVQERRKMQEFIDLQVARGKLTKVD